jgi:hypothetical protein
LEDRYRPVPGAVLTSCGTANPLRIDTEVFFRPEEVGRETSSIRADLYSNCRKALTRSITDCAFVPVRSMQLLAVVTLDEIVFVDNLNYAVHGGQGGRLIMLAWDLSQSGLRNSLEAPVPLEIVHFHKNSADLHARLMSEFLPALQTLEEYERVDHGVAEIIPIRCQ